MTDAVDRLPDLAGRALGGTVVYANDDFYASAHNLLTSGPAAYDPAAYDILGKVYDGWETRRRRDRPHGTPSDFVIVRLGAPGIVHGVTIDTAHFTGNYPASASVHATTHLGYPSPDELRRQLGPDYVAAGHARNWFATLAEQPSHNLGELSRPGDSNCLRRPSFGQHPPV